jgi:hypothetical protein
MPAYVLLNDARCDELKRSLVLQIQNVTPMAIAIGNDLLELKSILPHGKFAEWCKSELNLQPRRAQIWMSHAITANKLGPDAENLSLEAIKATWEASPQVREEVLEEARKGSPPSSTEVRRREAAHRRGSADLVTSDDLNPHGLVELAETLRAHLPSDAMKALRDFLVVAKRHDIDKLLRALSKEEVRQN